MKLQGSCHCGAVRFTVDCPHPYPFNLCYCSICRKTAGGGGFAINLGGRFDSLTVEGRDHLSVYQAKLTEEASGKVSRSPAKRHFCRHCGSALWLWDPRWPELVHPHASAIDTELPIPPQHSHLMVGSKANWVAVHAQPGDKVFGEYPDESLAQWHQRLALEDPPEDSEAP
ncbi:GFA family protein [Marinobacter sp. SS21]|uniref:GFA family protein n=1 Tax=Marinobacter sp. SS21 TaxID=2979460 RepID=UPI00232BBFBC|nr:GFA family protein [Marinobacter sp. SS21]MDC0661552.1 GFA family protein [Marinobacter sp. SS21]